MKKTVVLFFICAVCCLYVTGQNRNTLVQRINDIKSQSEVYYWDQYTCPDADTAKVNATKRLLLDVNNQRAEGDYVTVEEIMPYASYINIDRGNLKQCFAYIKKSDAAVLKRGSQTSSAYSEVSREPEVKSVQPKSFVPDAFVQRVMETQNFVDVYKLLKSLQSQGQILQFGKLSDVEDYSSLELILFDMQSQRIITMLSYMNNNGYRTNLVTGTDDSLTNYPTNMTAVIWYIKK